MNNTIGLYGLGVMGQSLTKNLIRNQLSVSVYNYVTDITDQFVKENKNELLFGYNNVKDFISSLKSPKTILMVVTAGDVVDKVIHELTPYLNKGDILVDCGNSYFKDSIRRYNDLKKLGIHYIDMGVSGGEMGALYGPSLMPAGDFDAYKVIEPILLKIAAKADGEACCSYISGSGSGHFVKMVHNGIEYGDMQLICECYEILKKIYKYDNKKIKDVFLKFNEGKLNSYLIGITADILDKKDDVTNNYLLDMILDSAGQKGTGKWASMESLDLGVCFPTITQAVYARYISSLKDTRVTLSKQLSIQPIDITMDVTVEDIEKALYCGKIIAYSQGFSLMEEASKQYGWDLNYGKISSSWKNGCIIRAKFLSEIECAFKDKDIINLLSSPYFSKELKENIPSLRKVVVLAKSKGIYIPGLDSCLDYYDAIQTEVLPANLIQAQRDYFGAHTYRRVDDGGQIVHHTKWEK